jgi:hypothetical protein
MQRIQSIRRKECKEFNLTNLQLPTDGRRLGVEQRSKHGRERAAVPGAECAVGGVVEVFLCRGRLALLGNL